MIDRAGRDLARRVARLRRRGPGERYPARLRTQITAWVRARRDQGAWWCDVSRDLGLPAETLKRWAAPRPDATTARMVARIGLQAALRVSLLDANVQPFLFGGVAWRTCDLTNEGLNTSAISSTDDVLELPVGAGLAWKYRGLMLDARGEFRYATSADMVPDTTIDENGNLETASMHRYGFTANVGDAF